MDNVGQRKHPYLEALFNNTRNAVISIDQHFRVIDFNPAAKSIFGWSYEEDIGRDCPELLQCKNLNSTILCGTSRCPLVRALQQQYPIANEELIIGADPNHCVEFSVTVTPVDGDEGPGVIVSGRDMTDVKVANRVRTNFVSMVSHELRTPLNSVHGFVELLLQGHMGELTEEQARYLGYAQEGVQQLMSIVEDILFMTRSDSGQFEIKPQEVNFRVLAKQVVNSLQPQALKAEVVINKDIPSPSPILYVDPQRMKQVLNNLLTNAIKFTPPGGTITISARPYDERFAMISISDTGTGIPVEDRAHIFERFYQSNSRQQSKIGGYGLGLPIARLIVEQHGGTIGFDTVLDKGTTFYFTAPFYKEEV